MDHKAQAFAEEAIRSVGRLDAGSARTSIAQAFEVDHDLGALADAVYLACAEIDADGGVSTPAWNTLGDAVDTADLYAVVEEARS